MVGDLRWVGVADPGPRVGVGVDFLDLDGLGEAETATFGGARTTWSARSSRSPACPPSTCSPSGRTAGTSRTRRRPWRAGAGGPARVGAHRRGSQDARYRGAVAADHRSDRRRGPRGRATGRRARRDHHRSTARRRRRVDMLAHVPVDRDLTADLIARGVVLIPTLTMMRSTTAVIGAKPMFRLLRLAAHRPAGRLRALPWLRHRGHRGRRDHPRSHHSRSLAVEQPRLHGGRVRSGLPPRPGTSASLTMSNRASERYVRIGFGLLDPDPGEHDRRREAHPLLVDEFRNRDPRSSPGPWTGTSPTTRISPTTHCPEMIGRTAASRWGERVVPGVARFTWPCLVPAA